VSTFKSFAILYELEKDQLQSKVKPNRGPANGFVHPNGLTYAFFKAEFSSKGSHYLFIPNSSDPTEQQAENLSTSPRVLG
jgi:hypothetical protein